MKKILFVCVLVLVSFVNVYAIDININGEMVVFSDNSGYPFLDENNRVLVPLRITMEAAGAYVVWNASNQTARIVSSNRDISITVGEAHFISNGRVVGIDTTAIIRDGKIYLPIRSVLEEMSFSVEWDKKTQTLFGYNHDFSSNDWIPYSTGNLKTLVNAMSKGYVVYYDGQYWASPRYAKMHAMKRMWIL